MGTASFSQNSFLGGEWSPQMQGRFDRPDYRTGLNICTNVIPTEEGAAPRRSGTRLGGVTRSGNYGVLREYHVNQEQPYILELTTGFLRLWQAGASLITHPGTAVTDISSANPAVFTSAGHGLTTGDQVLFTLTSATTYAGISQILGRQLSVTVSGSTFTAVDALTGAAIDGTLIDFSTIAGLVVYRIFEIATDYVEADLQQIRLVQDGVNANLLHHDYPPQTLVITTNDSGVFLDATLTETEFYDGPYLDIPADGTTLTPSATSGSITFTASSIASINGGQGFLSTDVGRMFRVFSEPAEWDEATSYPEPGLHVKDAGVYWRSVSENGQEHTGLEGQPSPSTDSGINWVIDPSGAKWTWGVITSVSAANAFVGTLHAAVEYPDNIAGGDLLYEEPIIAWQLGVYCEEEGYPACGAYYQGRIWLGGAIKNRFDACVSNDFAANGYINFAPTGKDGTVADNNGIAATLNSNEIEDFLWMIPDEQGILAGTQSGEWVIASSALGEPITPTSILTREPTRYGSLDAQAVKVGRATIFIHRDRRKIYEYMANYFTQKFVADNLSLKAKHLTKGKIAELAFMRELTPVIWARLDNGGLIGCTYKHDDPIQPLEFAGWHKHELGTGRDVISIQGGPANGGETDTLSMVTQDPTTGFCYVEFLQTIWDDGDTLLTAWYVDGGISVAAAELVAPNTIRLYGLWYMAGEEVTVWGAGLDLGDYTVTSDGMIDLALNAADSLFTNNHLADVTALGCTSLSVDILGTDAEEGAVTVYLMSAEENYDSTRVDYIAAITDWDSTYPNTDQNNQGIQWDPVRRNLMYLYRENIPESPTTNNTGFTLWDGTDSIAPNDPVDPGSQWNTSVGVKSIDTGDVTFYLNYDVDNIVPASIGGTGVSVGGWRRFTREFYANNPTEGGNGPGMTDPYTGNFWIDSVSCQLYCFRLQDNYTQTISPLQTIFNVPNATVQVIGFVNVGNPVAWTFTREIDPQNSPTHAYLHLTPREFTAEEITADYLLKYATFTYPVVMDTNAQRYHYYNREIFDHSGNMYLFSCDVSGGKNFKLYKFVLPSSAPYGGPTVGGGFSDITPWAAGTGPNADGPAYTLARTGPAGVTLETSPVLPMYLPGTDDLVLIERFIPDEHTNGSFDPALFFWSCTYVHDPSGTPTFDHHSAFVTGYMTAAWEPTDAVSATYSVIDAFEVNAYLGQTDYDYSADIPGLDYTRRWFFFACLQNAKPRMVLVEYEFVYGSPPAVVQVIDEQGWDDRYTQYAPINSDAYPPYDSVDTQAVAVSMNTSFNPNYYYPLWDTGIHDPVTNSFWWSGGATNSFGETAFFSGFDVAFADRMKTGDDLPGGSNVAATPPFLKLSFGLSYCAPFAVGHTYCSRAQILRPVTPNEGMTQTGPGLGKFRRTTDAMVLLADTQGMSMGVDFLTMRPLAFKTNNGIGQAGGGVTTLPLTQTFSGVHKQNVDADSNFDNMWCWEVCRPYPCTVVAVELQHKTNENI